MVRSGSGWRTPIGILPARRLLLTTFWEASHMKIKSIAAILGIALPLLAFSDTPAASTPRAIDPTTLDVYVGDYELAPKVYLTIRRDQDSLKAQITGQPSDLSLERV